MSVIRFPSPTRYADPDAFLEQGVYRWLCRCAGTKLYRHFRTGEVLPTCDELADWLHSIAWPKISNYVTDYQTSAGHGQWTGAYYRRQLERAAAYCLDNYDPVPVYLRAAKGGRNSRRGAKFTVHDLAAHDGLSIAEQARAIGCSPREVSYLRAEIREWGDASTAALFENTREKVTA